MEILGPQIINYLPFGVGNYYLFIIYLFYRNPTEIKEKKEGKRGKNCRQKKIGNTHQKHDFEQNFGTSVSSASALREIWRN